MLGRHSVVVTLALSTTSVAIVSAAMLAAQRREAADQTRYDIIVRHGTIVDGTGAARFAADLGIAGDRIAAIGDLAGAAASREIDATDLVVAPGFINIHSHAVPDGLPTAVNMLSQGVTTEILNPDGGGSLDIAAQLNDLAAKHLAVNVGAAVGFNSVWTEVVGQSNRRPTSDDIARMRAMISRNLEAGAWGISAGLDYKPAYFASVEEVVQIVSVAGKWRTNFPNHDRLAPETGYSSKVGIGETVEIGKRSRLMPVITHMKIQGHEQGTADAILASMRAETAAGVYVAADAYPYLAGQTGLAALIIPGWAQEGGRDRMLERFADPGQRARIVAESEEAMAARFEGPSGIYLPATGEQLTDVMKAMDASGGEAVVRLLERGDAGAILRFGAEADLVKILQHPTTAIACDCGASTATRGGHPRYYGTFPRVLGHYVRETSALTLEDAVRKSSGLPASIEGMVDRGFLAVGMYADVAVFDPRTIIDHATYEKPNAPSDGVRWVIVNGSVAFDDGQPTGIQAGRALFRAAQMPSRPMRLDVARRLATSGTLTTASEGGATSRTFDVAVDVSQTANARSASGRVRLTDRASGSAIEATSLGLLQTASGWASLTGHARVGKGVAEEPFLLIVDAANPLVSSPGTDLSLAAGTVRVAGQVKTTAPTSIGF